MTDDRKYFRVEPDSPAMEKLQEFLETLETKRRERRELGEEFGAVGSYGSEYSLKALYFESEDDIPDKWKAWGGSEHEGKVLAGPFGNSKKARQDKERLRTSSMPGAGALTKAMTGADTTFWDFGAYQQKYMGWQKLGDVHILYTPDYESYTTGDDPWEPLEGMTLIKTSEFYQLKEQHECAEAGAN